MPLLTHNRHSNIEVASSSMVISSNGYPSHNPFKPPVYHSLTGSHGPSMCGGVKSSQTHKLFQNDPQLAAAMKECKENSSINSNIGDLSKKSSATCYQPSRSSIVSAGTNGSSNGNAALFNGKASFTSSGKDSIHSRSSSNAAFKGDRFIPFRGTTDNFMEEFIINNDVYKD